MWSFNLDLFTENEEQKKKLLDVKQKKPDIKNTGIVKFPPILQSDALN